MMKNRRIPDSGSRIRIRIAIPEKNCIHLIGISYSSKVKIYFEWIYHGSTFEGINQAR